MRIRVEIRKDAKLLVVLDEEPLHLVLDRRSRLAILPLSRLGEHIRLLVITGTDSASPCSWPTTERFVQRRQSTSVVRIAVAASNFALRKFRPN